MKRTTTLILGALLAAALSMTTSCSGTLDFEIRPTSSAEATIATSEAESSQLVTEATQQAQELYRLGRLAYVQGGDIWIRTLPDGEPQRLTTDGLNSQPRWSPSGEWLAFRKGDLDQVWIMRVDGEQARPLNGGNPIDMFAWSPVEDRLAYVGLPQGGLYVQGADEAEPITLVHDAWVDPATPPPEVKRSVGQVAWSPDGTRIAYTLLERPIQPGGAIAPPSDQGLWVLSGEGGEPQELYVSGVPERGAVQLFGWTADGEYLLFWQGEILSASMLADGVPLYALPADGGEPTQLIDAALPHSDFVAPAPAGSVVAVVAGSGRLTWNSKRIALVHPHREEITRLGSDDAAALSPAWSPGGTRLAYSAGPTGEDWGGEPVRQLMMARRIWLAGADGAGLQRLTDDPAYRDEYPLWSADGSHILFVRLDAEGRVSLWLASVDGGEPQLVVEELTPAPDWFGNYGHITWGQYFDWWRG